MSLTQLSISRPVTVSVAVLLLVLFGLLSLLAIPVQLTPNVDVPVVTVETHWRGATPAEVEREIVERQEEQLQSVKGVTKMTSTASDNRAQIRLEFVIGTDKSEALRDVTDKLRQVTGYPPEVDEPTVQAADSSVDNPIAWLILYSDEDAESGEVRKLQDFAEDYIKPYLDRVPGVASVNIYGGMQREMQVRVRAGELAARGLTFNQLIEALQRQNENISAGTRAQGKRDFSIRTVGQFESAEQILGTVITYTAGGPVYVRDVADVCLDYAEPTSFVRSKGQFVLAFPVRREVGTNVIQVMNGVRQAVERVNAEVLRARNMRLEMTQVYDETVYINQSIAMVNQNIVYGGALAIVVLTLFLRNWRATLVVALAIPVSVVGTFVLMAALGRTLNVISLAGIAFAVGMVVDNSVVVLENIYRHYQSGKNAFKAALDGTNEVWGAVLASTLTTMAVFIPVIFVQEEAGQLFRDISVATVAAVGLSLLVSVTVIPPLAARLLGRRGPSGKSSAGPEVQAGHGRLANTAASIIAALGHHPILRLCVIAFLTLGSLALTPLLVPDTTYLPAGNRNLVFGFLLTPPGYSMEEFERMAHVIEREIGEYWRAAPGSPEHQALDERWIRRISARIAAGGIPELTAPPPPWYAFQAHLERERTRREWLTPPPLIDNFFFVAFNGGCFMGASSRDPARVRPLVKLLSVAGQQIPGVYPVFFQTQIFSFGGGNTAEVVLRGDNLQHVVDAANAMFTECMQRFGFPQPSPRNFNLGRPEIQVSVDQERASDLGLRAVDVGRIVEACVDGTYVGDYRDQGGNIIDLRVYFAGQRGQPTGTLGNVPIYTPIGQVVPLSAAVRILQTTALEEINHTERQRSVSLTINPPEALALEEVTRQITREIEPQLRQTGRIAPDVIVTLTGNADKLIEARNTMIGRWEGWSLRTAANILGSRFALSLIITYLLMAALYESWIYPFVIMFSVPLAIFGGFLGLKIAYLSTLMTTDQPVQQLDVLTFLGFVILVGIVVNNAILLVDCSLQNLRIHGLPLREAILQAVRTRIRPVFMTSLTTFFGQLPLALMPGAGIELYRGLAAVMLGGLLIATLGTLVLVPLVLHTVAAVRERYARPAAAAGAITLAPAPRDR